MRDGGALNNASSTVIVEGLVKGVDLSNHNAKPITGTKISTDELTFDQKMRGSFSNINAVFTAGTEVDENGNFESNKIQFMAYLNGEIYQTANIVLSGSNATNGVIDGSGYKGLGDKIAGEMKLDFHKVGSKDTDVGFQVTVQDEGITLNSSNLDDLQQELNLITNSVSTALERGEVKLSVIGASYTVEDFSLNSADSYFWWKF